ncbi:hypothetical protein OAG68_02695 [bacterium]|nr:hypothetical protein [bacterium]
MRFSIKQLLLQISLLAVVLALPNNPTLFACVAVSAVYSHIFPNSLDRHSREFYGVLGAIIAWLLPVLLFVGTDHFGYFTGYGSSPYFDGDGPIWGGLIAPSIWLLYTIVPVAIMGWVIGSSSRLIHLRFLKPPNGPQVSE